MDGRVVYDVMIQGSASSVPGTIFAITIACILLILFIISIRRVRESGGVLKSRNQATTIIWNFIARRYNLIIVFIIITYISSSSVLAAGYYKTHLLLVNGDYHISAGSILGDSIVNIVYYPLKTRRHPIGMADLTG